MSKEQAARPAQNQQSADAGSGLRAEVDALKQSFADLALMLMPHSLRNWCACGKIACRSVQTTKPGAFAPSASDVGNHYLCDECKIPEGHAPIGEVALGPAERETVRLANRLGCLRRP